jgi:DNA-binding transcriptional LysR family regulator
MDDELQGMTVFVAVAETGSLRAAGDRLGVSGSAVGQALRKLEERLGVALAQRTTRSVHLTAAGERLYATLRPALDGVRAVVAEVTELGGAPRGALRLHVSAGADTVLGGSLFADFLAEHPHVELDMLVSDARVDIVAAGFDAGIQLGEVIDRDMIAIPVTGELRMVVVGAPAYFARYAPPRHPRDLVEHVCLNWHATAEAPPYRWEFTETAPSGARDFAIAVPARVLTNDAALNVRLARAGVGLTMALEDRVRDDLAHGALVSVLEPFCTPYPGYYLYYPQRRHASPVLRAFVEFLRRSRRSATSLTSRAEGPPGAPTPRRSGPRRSG